MKRRILILAPHTDDGELGCGATIARFVEENEKFSMFLKEVKNVTSILGFTPFKFNNSQTPSKKVELGRARNLVRVNHQKYNFK